MPFADDLKRFTLKVETKNKDLFVNTVAAVHESIVNGSAVTGAPGQPVDTGNLRNSWIADFVSPTRAVISTNVAYAPIIEDNIRGAKFHNHGPHSVELTIAGFPALVADENDKLGGGA